MFLRVILRPESRLAPSCRQPSFLRSLEHAALVCSDVCLCLRFQISWTSFQWCIIIPGAQKPNAHCLNIKTLINLPSMVVNNICFAKCSLYYGFEQQYFGWLRLVHRCLTSYRRSAFKAVRLISDPENVPVYESSFYLHIYVRCSPEDPTFHHHSQLLLYLEPYVGKHCNRHAFNEIPLVRGSL